MSYETGPPSVALARNRSGIRRVALSGDRRGNVSGSRRVARWGRALLDTILPRGCLACRQPVTDRGLLGLCAACRRKLAAPPEDACGGCGESLGDVSRCPACAAAPPPWDRLVWAYVYRPPLDAVLAGFKFHRLDYLGKGLGKELAARLEDEAHGDVLPRLDAVQPVPLHWTRRLGRGYDQAQLVAEAVAETLGLPVLRALRRRRGTAVQSLEDRAGRRANLHRAFAPRRRVDGLRLLLVDDVVTTGATLEAAARALHRAGAAGVVAAAVARTPKSKEIDKCASP